MVLSPLSAVMMLLLAIEAAWCLVVLVLRLADVLNIEALADVLKVKPLKYLLCVKYHDVNVDVLDCVFTGTMADVSVTGMLPLNKLIA